MIRLNLSALAGLGLLAATISAAHAEDGRDRVLTAGDTSYINGGFGDDEIDYMRQNAPKYSLRMEFSEGGKGAFVADVNLAIADPKGRTIFALPSAGPLTDVMLPPGTYKVSASYEGKTETQEVAIGGPGGQGKDISFSWKGEPTE